MQQPLVQNPQTGAEQNSNNVVAKSEVRIVKAETGTCFFVMGIHGDEELKKIVRDELKGVYNHKKQGYKFPARDYDRVAQRLGLTITGGLIDPAKLIEVTFTQKFQYNGDMVQAEQFLKSIGLTKQAKSANSWTGDVSVAPKFIQVFNQAN